MAEIHLNPEGYIELNAFIKIRCALPTGGRAKELIRSGAVKVNGKPETRNKLKLRKGDTVVVQGDKWTV